MWHQYLTEMSVTVLMLLVVFCYCNFWQLGNNSIHMVSTGLARSCEVTSVFSAELKTDRTGMGINSHKCQKTVKGACFIYLL